MNAEFKSLQKELTKQFGDQAFTLGIDGDDLYQVQTVSSGSVNLDLALGTGLPVGRIVEYYGSESVGKTTMALLAMKEFQKRFPEKYVGFIDIESALDITLLKNLDIDMNKISLSKGLTGEQAFDLIESLIISNLFSIICVDSVTALIPLSEQENGMDQQTIGLQARLLSKGLKKISPLADKYGVTILFLNQLREKIGTFSAYGTPTTTSGGRALRFYSTIRLEFKKGEPIKDPNDSKKDIGHIINARCVKNKIARPNKQATFPLVYAQGVDKIAELADYMILTSLVTKGGAWLSIKKDDQFVKRWIDGHDFEMKWQGKQSLIDYLKQDESLAAILLQSIEEESVFTVDDLINFDANERIASE